MLESTVKRIRVIIMHFFSWRLHMHISTRAGGWVWVFHTVHKLSLDNGEINAQVPLGPLQARRFP